MRRAGASIWKWIWWRVIWNGFYPLMRTNPPAAHARYCNAMATSKITPLTANNGLHSTEELLADLAAGKMVVVMDDEDRENEGDLIMAAEHVRPADINFMARYGRGLICLTLTRERCRQLRLPLMVSETDERQTTNFTLSIEAAEGVTTGISAH